MERELTRKGYEGPRAFCIHPEGLELPIGYGCEDSGRRKYHRTCWSSSPEPLRDVLPITGRISKPNPLLQNCSTSNIEEPRQAE